LIFVFLLFSASFAITNPPITGTTPYAVSCPNSLCEGKHDGNFEYKDPKTHELNRSYFLQCVGGTAYCQACFPMSLQYSATCNQCLYDHKDECVTTKKWEPATTFYCPDMCSNRGPDFSGNMEDPYEARQYIGCWKGVTVGCVACPHDLKFNEEENACLYEGKYLTMPVKQ